MYGYKPKPYDTSKIELDAEIYDLLEDMAENVHERWAQTRIEQGWQYGSMRDDNKKLHPCIIPYSQLPESEKEYDRNSARETLKFLKLKGFEIVKRG